jgi:hypothetical protein
MASFARPGTARRVPTWSGGLTGPIARRIPRRWRSAAALAIKGIHTVACLLIASLVAVVAADGLRQAPRRRTALAAAVSVSEAFVYVSNNQVCPLSPLAVELGARSGTVTDIFLPEWVSRRVPFVSGTALVVGLILNLRAWRKAGREARGKGPGPRDG